MFPLTRATHFSTGFLSHTHLCDLFESHDAFPSKSLQVMDPSSLGGLKAWSKPLGQGSLKDGAILHSHLKPGWLFQHQNTEMDTTMYKLQCSGVFRASGSLLGALIGLKADSPVFLIHHGHEAPSLCYVSAQLPPKSKNPICC